jgi:TPR repeat protein
LIKYNGLLSFFKPWVPQGGEIAVKWDKKAAVQGRAAAYFSLGLLHYNGMGVPKNLVRAHAYLNVSAISGDLESAKRMSGLEKNMTPQQITEAKALAKRCIESDYKDCE